MKSERVTIVAYNPEWPDCFERERATLATIFEGGHGAIEHIGSTSVPGLGAKPVIDIMVGAPKLADVEIRIAALESIGYEYVREFEAQLPARRYFRKSRLGTSQFHLHCVVIRSEFWISHLAFRDYLRAHSETAAEYYELKKDLANRVKKAEYTEAKSPFIQSVLSRASDDRQHRIPAARQQDSR